MTDEKRLFIAIHYNLNNEPEETFSYIYEKYKPLLMFIASRYLKSETDIEDIVHNTFIEFFNNLDNIHTTIKSYLSVCCKTNALDYLRSKGKVTFVEPEKLSYLIDETFTYNNSNDNYKELIENMKLYLTKEDITIILLHLIDDLKFDDIALKLNRKVKTIKTKYYRALKKYQKMKGVK